MPHQRSNITIEKDAQVNEAVHALIKRKFKSIRAIERAFRVPYLTLKHQVHGRKTRVQSHEQQQILTPAEESELTRWITELTAIGYPPGFSLVREMGEELDKLHIQQINDNSIEHVRVCIRSGWARSTPIDRPDWLQVGLPIDSNRSNRLKVGPC